MGKQIFKPEIHTYIFDVSICRIQLMNYLIKPTNSCFYYKITFYLNSKSINSFACTALTQFFHNFVFSVLLMYHIPQ